MCHFVLHYFVLYYCKTLLLSCRLLLSSYKETKPFTAPLKLKLSSSDELMKVIIVQFVCNY